MTDSIRVRVSGNYRGPTAGSWEINKWLDLPEATAIVALETLRTQNESVKVLCETKLPSGRWGKRTVEIIR